jgi:hypothetical protein
MTEQLIIAQHNLTVIFEEGWFDAFVGRHRDALEFCRSLSQEDTRLIVSREHLEAHIERMKSIVAGNFAEPTMRSHIEVASSDGQHRKPRKIIPPRAVSPYDVSHLVSRRDRHLTLLACVSAGGVSSIRDEIWSAELRENDDAMFRFRIPAYMTEELFHEYLTNVFIPYILQLRENLVSGV